ncbi:MAG TPA: RNA polymerase factor sigma-54 [Desulfosalsimonadaceae bacterium]|nr:RNA polymerase factor sigma-54 [Desulfosalsimonadaceae bacterium]
MALELQQNLKLQQQLVMTPQLQMAIKLLQLSRMELVETIQQELETNPTLEEVQETEAEQNEQEQSEQEQNAEEKAPQEVSMEEKFDEFVDWQNYLDEFNSTGKLHLETEKKEAPDYEAFTASKTSLADHLRWQLLMTKPSEEEEFIGSCIIGCIDEDGYLDTSLEEIAEMAGATTEKADRVLSVMQHFDPTGICSRDLKECLLIQADHLGIDDPLVIGIISNHLKDLENKRYKAIARALHADIDEIVAAVELIKQLDPKPGDRFAESDQIYIVPDVYVYRYEDDFVILLNEDDMPRVQINSYYKKAVKKGEPISREAKNYLKDRLRSAEWLIKSIQHRRKTIYNVMASIVKFQRDFFEYGVSHLKPLVLRDVAEDIEMHESTISRVTNNKYAYTPQGIFELKFFFNSSINRSHGDNIASASVQEKIRKIVEQENPKKPYSDKKIAEMLKEGDIDIARRTVAKYRENLGILPSSKRKQY